MASQTPVQLPRRCQVSAACPGACSTVMSVRSWSWLKPSGGPSNDPGDSEVVTVCYCHLYDVYSFDMFWYWIEFRSCMDMVSTESGLWHIITSCNRYMVGYKPIPKYPVGLSENGGKTRCFPLLNHDSPQESDLKMRVFSDTKFQSMLFKLISLWKPLWATHLIWQGHCCGFK